MGKWVLAIDPGTTQSASVGFNGTELLQPVIMGNFEMLANIRQMTKLNSPTDEVAIEMVASYGMPVGETVFQTVLWIGQFKEALESRGFPVKLIYRKDVKMHLCNSPRANDASIRQALIDRFGAPGTKKNPGVLYGIKKDLWAALSVAVTYSDLYLCSDSSN